MFRWMYQNLLDEQREELADALLAKLEHSTSCPKRYSQHTPTCVCHVEKAAWIVRNWGME